MPIARSKSINKERDMAIDQKRNLISTTTTFWTIKITDKAERKRMRVSL